MGEAKRRMERGCINCGSKTHISCEGVSTSHMRASRDAMIRKIASEDRRQNAIRSKQ